MNLPVSIALSHLLSRRRQTLVSLSGICLGVAFFLAVSALMRGSEEDFMRRLVDNSPHVTVYDEYRNPRPQAAALAYPKGAVEIRGVTPETEIRGIRQYKQKLDYIAHLPGLRVAPVLVGQAIVTFAGQNLGATLNGIVPEQMKNVSTIDEHFVTGSLDSLYSDPNGIIIGTGLADKFRLRVGNKVTVTSPTGVVRVMKVVALFRTGNAIYDEGQTFVRLDRAQTLLERPNIANRLILQLDDPNRAPAVAHQIEASLGYKTQSWQESNEDLMNLVKIRNLIMYSVVAATLIVAAFGIYNVISTVVLEKTRDIAILKSIGFHARDIRRIFLVEGIVLGGVGSLLGTALGLAFMAGLARVEIKSPLFTTQAYLPIYWGFDQIAVAAGFAMLSAVVAAYLPARKGGRVQPVEILRGAA